MRIEELRSFLDEKVETYNRPEFIKDDPISIPRAYQLKQDIEITGFITAVLSWGQRKTIINKCLELFQLMDNQPYDFIINHAEQDLKPILHFKHRTFNATDALYFIAFLKSHYSKFNSLEAAFLYDPSSDHWDAERGIAHLNQTFFSIADHPKRTHKHISNPLKNSACKRINMFLRWMVRQDHTGVDFGLWEKMNPSELVCPCDVHVDRVARALGLITRKQTDWKTAIELTENLRLLDSKDPVKYDFALFGLGVVEKFP